MANNKALLKVNEDDILRFADKIRQNREENERFSKVMEDFLSGSLKHTDTIFVETTPYALQLAGAKELPLTIAHSTLINSMNSESIVMKHHTSGHDVEPRIIINLPQLLREPIMIIKDRANDNLTVILDETDKQGRNIICRITLDKKENQHIVNRVSSVYGKRELANFINRAFNERRVKALHKEKAESLLQSIGCQSPKEEAIISFDNSIAYSFENVNPFTEKFLTNFAQKEPEIPQSGKMSLNEQIDRERAKNPRLDATKQGKQQSKNHDHTL